MRWGRDDYIKEAEKIRRDQEARLRKSLDELHTRTEETLVREFLRIFGVSREQAERVRPGSWHVQNKRKWAWKEYSRVSDVLRRIEMREESNLRRLHQKQQIKWAQPKERLKFLREEHLRVTRRLEKEIADKAKREAEERRKREEEKKEKVEKKPFESKKARLLRLARESEARAANK